MLTLEVSKRHLLVRKNHENLDTKAIIYQQLELFPQFFNLNSPTINSLAAPQKIPQKGIKP